MKKNTLEKTHFSKLPGFTLVEFIIYFGVMVLFLTISTNFSWDILFGQVKTQVAQEVQQNSRHAVQRLIYEIRRAKAINSVGSSLSLTMPDDTTVIFDLDGSGTLRINEGGAGAVNLTSNKVQITSLTFSDRSAGNSKNVKVDFTISHLNPENVQEWERTESFSTTIELRGQ